MLPLAAGYHWLCIAAAVAGLGSRSLLAFAEEGAVYGLVLSVEVNKRYTIKSQSLIQRVVLQIDVNR